jgi:hypothetical protein
MRASSIVGKLGCCDSITSDDARLIDRYIEEVLKPCLNLPVGGKQDEAAQLSFHCAKCYKSLLDRWVRPRWQNFDLRQFEQPATRAAIEQWFRSL